VCRFCAATRENRGKCWTVGSNENNKLRKLATRKTGKIALTMPRSRVRVPLSPPQKKFFGSPGHEIGRADRTPDGQQDGSTTRRRAGFDVAASAASNPSGRAIQISLKAPHKRLDRQLRRAPYRAIRQLSNVRAAPQVTTLKVLLLPTPRCFPQFPGFIAGGAQLIR
jgi:hypothetical protein